MTHAELWFKKPDNSLLSKLIAWRGRRFSHVELVFVSDTAIPLEKVAYSAYSADGTVGGVRHTFIKWDSNKWERVPLYEFTKEDIDGMEEYISENLIYTPYDYKSILEEAMGKTPTDRLAYNCSQFCTKVLQAVGGIFRFIDIETVSPGDLYCMAAARAEMYSQYLAGDL